MNFTDNRQSRHFKVSKNA